MNSGALRTLLVGIGLLAVGIAPSGAQSAQQQNDQILQELKAIRALLERIASPPNGQPGAPAAPPNDNVTITNLTGYTLGKPDAPLTMVEFADLQCPFCRQFHVTAYEQIKKDYIDTGKLRWVTRDFPLPSLHPLAETAARASRCAADQNKFWEMRHTILVNNAALTPTSFATFAADLKMDVAAFKACEATAATKFRADLQKDAADGSAVGVSGTPTFVIGKTTATGVEGIRLVGAQPYANFDAVLKQFLAKP